MKQKFDLFAFSLMLFSVAIIVAASISESASKSFGDFAYAWQTLLAGGLAIVAALIAVRPVRQQLSKLNIQTSIMAREVLANRLSASETRRLETKRLIDGITANFSRDMYFDDNVALNPHWAFEAERKVIQVIEDLSGHQNSKMDSALIDAAREQVFKSARDLENCLYKIHAPYSGHLDDPELELSREEIEQIELESEIAPTQLHEKISALSRDADSLEIVFLSEAEKLKSKIRAIDNLIIMDQI